jgi:hypothetical protein
VVETLSPNFVTGNTGALKGLPCVPEITFTDHKGARRPRIEKRQRQLAGHLSFLRDFLEDGEKVLVITTAVSPSSILDQLTTGYIFAYIKRCLLVLTNKRIVHVPTTIGYRYRQSFAQIRYGDIESIAQKGSRLNLVYKSGAKEKFLYIGRAQRRKIRGLLPSLELHGIPTEARERVHLCPRCGAEQKSGIFECPSCSLEFKNRKKAVTLSVWLPGGGYFYTGHPLLGISDALVEVILILAVIGSLITTSEFPEPDVAGAIVFGVILVLEKLITVYHAWHFVAECLPKDRQVRPAEAFA